jgi:hypothetical protein
MSEAMRTASWNQVVSILTNQPKRVSKKQHIRFLAEEGDNIIFLLRKITHFFPSFQTSFATAFDFLQATNVLDPREPKLLLSKQNTDIEPSLSGYPKEYPRCVQEAPLGIATRVMVAEALARFSFYKKVDTIHDVLDSAMTRFLSLKKSPLQFRGGKLFTRSEHLIYFVTHIVLMATMWGECAMIGNIQWHPIVTCLCDWITVIRPVKQCNLEIWLEVLVCARLLGQSILPYQEETMMLFDLLMDKKFDIHTVYHTHVLWLFYFHASSSK